jgi:glycyl-tRNA synthetase
MGIKFAITIDFDTFNDDKVTIRERDSMKQVRVGINDELISTLRTLFS